MIIKVCISVRKRFVKDYREGSLNFENLNIYKTVPPDNKKPIHFLMRPSVCPLEHLLSFGKIEVCYHGVPERVIMCPMEHMITRSGTHDNTLWNTMITRFYFPK
jgi:hypothetical protein